MSGTPKEELDYVKRDWEELEEVLPDLLMENPGGDRWEKYQETCKEMDRDLRDLEEAIDTITNETTEQAARITELEEEAAELTENVDADTTFQTERIETLQALVERKDLEVRLLRQRSA